MSPDKFYKLLDSLPNSQLFYHLRNKESEPIARYILETRRMAPMLKAAQWSALSAIIAATVAIIALLSKFF